MYESNEKWGKSWLYSFNIFPDVGCAGFESRK